MAHEHKIENDRPKRIFKSRFIFSIFSKGWSFLNSQFSKSAVSRLKPLCSVWPGIDWHGADGRIPAAPTTIVRLILLTAPITGPMKPAKIWARVAARRNSWLTTRIPARFSCITVLMASSFACTAPNRGKVRLMIQIRSMAGGSRSVFELRASSFLLPCFLDVVVERSPPVCFQASQRLFPV